MRPRTVSVVGYKNSGKTKVVEAIVNELTKRGFKVGTLKHTADDIQLDTPGKDTYRHRTAGSKSSGILHNKGAAFFIDKRLSVQEAVYLLGVIDFLVIEGFKSLNTQVKILVPRKPVDVEKLRDGLEIAIVNTPKVKLLESNVPIIPLSEINNLVDLIEDNAFSLLPGLDCHDCGYDDCYSMGKALLKKEAQINQCVGFRDDFILRVNEVEVPLKGFVRDAMGNMILGFVKTLKGGESAKRIQLKFEAK